MKTVVRLFYGQYKKTTYKDTTIDGDIVKQE